MEININLNFGRNRLKTDGILILIILIAAFLRIYNIGFQDAWLDEIHTLKQADPLLSFSEFHQIIMLREGIPHFYFLLVNFLSTLFGSTIVVARLVSCIAGVLSVYYIYKLGKEIFNKNVGYFASLLLTFNVFHIEYSQEARSYALLTLFIIISYFYLVKFIKQPNFKTAFLLGLFSGLITNAHPIGLLNVGSIYLTLFLALLFQEKSKQKSFLLQSFLSGLTMLLVFFPVYQIVAKVSDIKVFWVAAPTFEGIKNVFIDLSSKLMLMLTITILFALFFLFMAIRNFSKEKKLNKLNTSFIVLFLWVFLSSVMLIVKSYIGPSMILQRYFIGILPGLILITAIGIELISSKFLKKGALIVVTALLISTIIYPNFYYTMVTKAQFATTCKEVLKSNPNNDKIVSSWGWLLSYYLDRENKVRNVFEINLDSYLEQVEDNALNQESFWYIDGNSRPYNPNPRTQEFISKQFTVDRSIQHNDCWAMHFTSKKAKIDNELIINLSDFNNAQFDGAGKLMFFENSKIDSKSFYLEKGNYEIELSGCSMPLKPIGNENAKMNIYLNNGKYDNYELSEKPNSKHIIKYTNKVAGNIVLSLEFINDFSGNNLDRNVQISSIKIKKRF